MIAASARIMLLDCAVACGGVSGENRLGQRLQPAGRCAALLRGRVRVVVEHPHAHARVDHLIEELDEEDVAGECRQVAKRRQLAREQRLPVVVVQGLDEAPHVLVQSRRFGAARKRRCPCHGTGDDQCGVQVVAGVVEREVRHDAGPVGQKLDQSFAREQKQRLPDGRARDLEAGGEGALVES